MSVLVSDVIGSSRDELLDNGSLGFYFWSDATLERFLNDVLAAAATLKRDIFPQIIQIPLAAGSVQTVPAGALQFMEPYFNLVSQLAVTPGSIQLIQRRFPNWRATIPAETDVTDAFADERSPQQFHVFPPNNGSGVLVALCGMIPVLSAIGCLPISNATIPIPDNYRQALVDGVVARAFGANSRRQDITKAQFYWERFQSGIIGAKMAQRETIPLPTDGTPPGSR